MTAAYTFELVKNCEMCGGTDFDVLGRRLNQPQGFRPHKLRGITVTVQQCSRCKLIFSNPRPIPEDIQDHYGTPPKDYWKEDYFDQSDDYFLAEIEKAKELIGFEAGMRALDIGAGMGKCIRALEKHGFDVYGLEPSETFWNAAVQSPDIHEERLICAAVEEAEFEEDSFDFITFGAVVEHLQRPSASIERALAWLKPHGIMHIEVPSSDYLMSKLVNFLYKVRGLDFVTNISPMHPPYHLYEFGLESFALNAKKSGYQIAEHEYFVCPIFHFPKVTHPPLKWIMKKNDSGMQLTVWLRKGSVGGDLKDD